jgi:hypothetical protein
MINTFQLKFLSGILVASLLSLFSMGAGPEGKPAVRSIANAELGKAKAILH